MTILKLGFAMGGGVSLGTFCAGALAQSIKLAILYGKDKKGEPYESVEIDVFSGASAGSISLAIMLRSLVAQTDEQLAKAKTALKAEYPNADLETLQNSFPRKWEALLAAEIMNQVQNDIWVKKVKMDKLLRQQANTNPPNRDYLKYTPGILNRAFLEELAATQNRDLPELEPDKPQKLLAERVVFASSLSNVTAINYNATKEFDVEKGGLAALSDGLNSQVHRESRVFDFHFTNSISSDEFKNNDTMYPDRWIRYHLSDSKKDIVGQLHKNDDVWYRVFATSIACGAFPGAFEPVLLERYDYEFSVWPEELKGYKSFNFTYFDGGTFNNEPIRDAFRLASFIDANDMRNEPFERAIFFVDPAVEKIVTKFPVDVHRRYTLSNPLLGDNKFGDIDGVDLVKKTSLDRLIPQLRDILLSIFRQARSVEGDKIFSVRKKFQERNNARKAIATDVPEQVSTSALTALIKHLQIIQKNTDKKALFPRASLNLEGEVHRVLREEKTRFIQFNSSLINKDISAISSGQPPSNSASDWYLLLQFLNIDEAMDLIGKTDHIEFFAIAPFEFQQNKAVRLKLEGDLIQAFGGFMSEDARQTDMEKGSWCARQALVNAGFMAQAKNSEIIPTTVPQLKDRDKYLREINKGVKDLINRIIDMIDNSGIPLLTSIPRVLLKLLISSYLKFEDVEECEQNLPAQIEIWIRVPDKKYELDGRGKVPIVGDKDIKPIKIDEYWYLITTIQLNNKCNYDGEHVSVNSIPIDIRNREAGRILLPENSLIQTINLLPYAYLEFQINEDNKDQEGRYLGEWKIKSPLIPLNRHLAGLLN